MTLAIDKLNGCGPSNTACRESLPQKDYQTVAMSRGVSVIKVCMRMHSFAFKEN